MSEAALALQAAMLACLRADEAVTAVVGDRIFDAAPRNAAFPYLAFGPARASDWSTGTESGTEQLLTLHVWSKAKGRREVLAVMEAIRARLADAALTLDDHHLVNLRLEFAEARYDDDLSVHHGLLRFRAVTEER